MKVKYIGEEDTFMSGKTFAFGREFRVNQVVDVPDDLRGRIERNRYFEVIEDTPPAPEPKPEPEQQNRMLAASNEDADHLERLERDDLIAKAERLGVSIDKRWGQARLIQAIREEKG